MTRFVYATATSLDGFLADADNSLDWLFAVSGGEEAQAAMASFIDGVGALVMGSTTYRWVLEHERLLEQPEKWRSYYGDRPTFVFSSRPDLPLIPGADIRLASGPVASHADDLRAAAAGRDVWVMGGGDLAGQFDDAGLLDAVRLSVAAVTLGSGAPLLPRRIESSRLVLREVGQAGQFAELRYDVRRPPA
jgi:dihydrofolate reductase